MASQPCAMLRSLLPISTDPYWRPSTALLGSLSVNLGERRVFVGRNGSQFVKKTRVYKRCFNLMVVDMEKFGGVKWFDLCFDFTMKIGKCLGSMRFSGGFFSKPSTKIPPSRKCEIVKSDSSVLGWDLPRCVINLYVYLYICVYIQYIFTYI